VRLKRFLKQRRRSTDCLNEDYKKIADAKSLLAKLQLVVKRPVMTYNDARDVFQTARTLCVTHLETFEEDQDDWDLPKIRLDLKFNYDSKKKEEDQDQ